MFHTTDATTSLTLYLTVKDRRTDQGFTGHVAYSVTVERPTATDAYAATTTTENDRYTRLDVTLATTLPAGEYPVVVYSMSAATAATGDRLGEVERGILVVSKSTANYDEHAINTTYREHQP